VLTDNNRLQSTWESRTQMSTDYKQARDGDHLLVPFECDDCIYEKLRGVHPRFDESRNQLLLDCIRQINLDAFWSRATSTVRANKEKTKLALALSHSVGLDGPYVQTRFLPKYDHCGYQVAVQMLLASKRPGKYSTEYSQYDTIRKIRTAYSNFARASSQANYKVNAFSDDRGMSQRTVQDPVSSYWFGKFFAGCRKRMGQDWRPNLALSTELLVKMVERIREKFDSPLQQTDEERMAWIVFGAYIVITYVLSLRGPEGLLIDLDGLRRHKDIGEGQYCIVALRGRIKGESSDRCHLLPCCIETSSGLKVQEWIHRLIREKEARGQVDGPAISDVRGKGFTTADLDTKLVLVLEDIFDESPSMFPVTVRNNRDEIGGSYQVFRSLRRSSDTRAVEKDVSRNDIETVNRWHGLERAQGGRPLRPMYQHYIQSDLLVKPYLRYTKAM
jgi:hypothetical protein